MSGRCLASNGVVVVLLLLYGKHSWATLLDQQPREAAAAAVMRQVRRDVAAPAEVLVVANPANEDRLFATAWAEGLAPAGHDAADVVVGTPRVAKVAIQRLAAANTHVAAIVTTPDTAASPVFDNLGMVLVILTGGVDLSVGSLIAVSAVATTLLVRDHGGTAASTGVRRDRVGGRRAGDGRPPAAVHRHAGRHAGGQRARAWRRFEWSERLGQM